MLIVKDIPVEQINNKLSRTDFTGVDLSEIPDEDWLNGLYIIGSCFETPLPGTKTIPSIFKGVFVGCNMNNHELHAGCSIEASENQETTNHHYIIANNGAPFTTTKASSYTALGTNLHAAYFIEIGLDPSAGAVPAKKLPEYVLHRAHRMMTYAKAHNIKDIDVFGEILTNPDYSILVV